MEKWEYLEVYISGSDWHDSSGNTGKLDAVTVGKIDNYFYNSTPVLNELGRSGWELEGMMHATDMRYGILTRLLLISYRSTEPFCDNTSR